MGANRVTRGVPSGGQYTFSQYGEPSVTLGTIPDAGPPYSVEQSEGVATFTEPGGASWQLDEHQPATIGEARKALRAGQDRTGRGRRVVLDHYRVRGWNDSPPLDVRGPADGSPLVIEVAAGFHNLAIHSGNVKIDVRKSLGGIALVKGGEVDVTVSGGNKFTVNSESGSTDVRVGPDARVRVSTFGGDVAGHGFENSPGSSIQRSAA